MADIINLNEKYREKVFKRFGIVNGFSENHLTKTLFTKTGVWLSYFNRNLFKYFNISKRKNVRIIENARITKIEKEGQNIVGIAYLHNGELKRTTFDHYFLTVRRF